MELWVVPVLAGTVALFCSTATAYADTPAVSFGAVQAKAAVRLA
ncbi:hypothetical protein [Streptomyces sp. NPDC040750]